MVRGQSGDDVDDPPAPTPPATVRPGIDLGIRRSKVVVIQSLGGSLVVSGEANGAVSVFDLQVEQKIAELDGPRSPTPVAAVAGVGGTQLFAAWQGSRTARCWDFQTGRVQEFLRPGPITNLVSLGAGRVACAIENREIEIYGPGELAESGRAGAEIESQGWISPQFVYTNHVADWRQTVLAPMGDGRIASAQASAVHIWSPHDSTNRLVIDLATRPVRALLALSPNRLVAGDEAGAIAEINLGGGEVDFATACEFDNPVIDVFRMNCHELGVTLDDGRVFVLDVDSLVASGVFQLDRSACYAPIGASRVVVGFESGGVSSWVIGDPTDNVGHDRWIDETGGDPAS